MQPEAQRAWHACTGHTQRTHEIFERVNHDNRTFPDAPTHHDNNTTHTVKMTKRTKKVGMLSPIINATLDSD